MQVVIEIPRGIDPHEFCDRATQLSVQMLKELARKRGYVEILTSDERMFELLPEYRNDYWGERADLGPYSAIVRAEVYGGAHIDYRQEICGYLQPDNRRPVHMRGSRRMMVTKSLEKNIAMRYLRRIRFTSLDLDQILDTISDIKDRMQKRGWYIKRSFLDYIVTQNGGWIEGEWVRASDEKYIAFAEQVGGEIARRLRVEREEKEAQKRYWELRERAGQRVQKTKDEKRKLRAMQVAALELITETSQNRRKRNA